MKLIKFILWLCSWATLWLLYAKKSGKDLRSQLKWKSNEEQAKAIWNELLELWKVLTDDLKKLPENKQVQELIKLWKAKLELLIKDAKFNKCQALKSYLPELEKALKSAKSDIKTMTKKAVKQAKSWAVKHVKKIKKAIKK